MDDGGILIFEDNDEFLKVLLKLKEEYSGKDKSIDN